MKNKILILIIIIISCYKLNLCGVGFFAMPDEIRYFESVTALIHLSHSEIKSAIRCIFSTQGRPGDVIVNLVPASIQYITFKLFDPKLTEDKNIPFFIFNWLIHCLVLLVHYKFSKLFLKNTSLALISVLFLSLLTNFFIYLRHALPYDSSLLLFYIIIYKISKYSLKRSISIKQSLFWGFLAFFSFTVYPGYFPLFFITGILLFFLNIKQFHINRKIVILIFFCLGSLICFLIFEIISWTVDMSYFNEAFTLSGTIIQGSFEESFIFAFKYLLFVEGITGIILLTGVVIFIVTIINLIKNKLIDITGLEILSFISILLMYILYASMGYFFHKFVMYGRLLHQYLPFIVIFAIYGFNKISFRYKIRQGLLFLFLTIPLFISFFYNISTLGGF